MSERAAQASALLTRFAERTGVSAPGASERYLWTDAFAVCTLLGLGQMDLALRLVEQVHRVLGRHRPDDVRRGWLSGLGEAEGEAHPTRGGLRIGKRLPERAPGERFDERREWDRDGQYFHYLTKWMHALVQVTRATGEARFATWALDLAVAAHRAFTYAPTPGGPLRMYWKMSIDLSRPLVPSMGQHDPLDGFVTCLELDAAAPGVPPGVRQAMGDFARMIDVRGLATDDPLGLGGLLVDAWRLAQVAEGRADVGALAETVLDAALAGLRHYVAGPELRAPAHQRLAFRELGLAIGLAALESPAWRGAPHGVAARLEALGRYLPLRDVIEAFWLEPEHRRVATWVEHENINDVTLATSLAPEGFLGWRQTASPRPLRG